MRTYHGHHLRHTLALTREAPETGLSGYRNDHHGVTRDLKRHLPVRRERLLVGSRKIEVQGTG